MKKVISLVFLSLLLLSCDKDKVFSIFLEEDLLEHPPSARCADCHSEIYKQWEKSRHAFAYKSKDFEKATNHYSKTKCLNCHIPLEMSKFSKPEKRNFNKEDGVNCVSCHYSSKTKSMHGPYDVFSPPHPSTKDLDFRSSVICSSCHQETYKQWKLANSTKSCQDCHMKPVKKMDLIQKFPFYLLHSSKEVYNHQFPVGRLPSLDVYFEKSDTTLKVKITNNSVPHNFPTADNGKPKVYLEIITYKNKKPIEQETVLITPKFSLAYNKPKTFEFSFWEEFDEVELKVYRKLSWQKEKNLLFTVWKKF